MLELITCIIYALFIIFILIVTILCILLDRSFKAREDPEILEKWKKQDKAD